MDEDPVGKLQAEPDEVLVGPVGGVARLEGHHLPPTPLPEEGPHLLRGLLQGVRGLGFRTSTRPARA